MDIGGIKTIALLSIAEGRVFEALIGVFSIVNCGMKKIYNPRHLNCCRIVN
jgi:hypothetical protein